MKLRIASLLTAAAILTGHAHAQTSTANPFVGTWQLVAADKLLPDGTRLPDYGPHPHGMAIFTADGHMMIEIFRYTRLHFAANDRAKGTPDEYRDVSLGSSCSFGTYTVDQAGGTVTMKLDRSTFPNADDTTQVRAYQQHDDTLSWKVPARPNGEIPITVLRRIAP